MLLVFAAAVVVYGAVQPKPTQQEAEQAYASALANLAPPTRAPIWYPAGFTAATSEQGGAVAWRWLTSTEVHCTYSDASCFGMYAVPKTGCPSSLYVELSLIDSAGNAVGYTNDVAGAVSPGQQAKLVFDTFDKTVKQARLSKISCY